MKGLNVKVSFQVSGADKECLRAYLNEIKLYEPLSAEEERQLAGRIKQGDQAARDKLVKANLRFVVAIAAHYQNRGLPLPDLISEGNIGLITAAERFDGQRNCKFISFAVYWIRQAMLKALMEQVQVVRTPSNVIGQRTKIKRARRFLEQEKGRRPRLEEIADIVDVSVEDMDLVISTGWREISIETPFDEEDEWRFLDIYPDPTQEPPDEALMQSDLKDQIADLMGVITDRERKVLTLYFGLGGEPPLNLAEIAPYVDSMSRERVRQLKESGLSKLRRHKNRILREYLED